ncbi:MAG TPA: cytochrome c oxidase assembly protein [Ferrovibrio sp.]|uniref:cytochrome c oxidase assembly protein n=1 Tax=Ferrovibrio sp. TaxID=1917215 RepID=UPI002ED18CDB
MIAALLAAVALYTAGRRRLSRRAGRPVIAMTARLAFYAAMAALAAALISPIDGYATILFSIHMVQHLLLIIVAAPLLAWSRPLLVLFWSLPRAWRKRLAAGWLARSLPRHVGWAAHPLSLWGLFCGIFVFWHLPGPYQWALGDDLLHSFEHVSLLAAAYGFWSVVIVPDGRRRLDYGTSLLFVASAAIFSGLPGALMILATHLLYAAHAVTVMPWSLTPLQDQQLAGLIMWIPAGMAYLAAICALFVCWLRDAEKRANARLTTIGPLLIVALLMAGCDEPQAAQMKDFGGNAERGKSAISQIGCGSCHIIPGVTGARGLAGPPLSQMGRRAYVAGVLPNTPENLMAWLQHPQRIAPGNAMPDMDLSERQARDIAAYLYTLR